MPSSTHRWPCPHPATSARHVGRTGRKLPGCTHPGTKPSAGLTGPTSPPPLPRCHPCFQGGATTTGGRGPGVGVRVPSSATVAAQPDSTKLLARGHLWTSGKSLSSSSGTDIRQQDRTTMHPSGRRGRHSWRATLPGRPLLNRQRAWRSPRPSLSLGLANLQPS